jgi:hypothetical protein
MNLEDLAKRIREACLHAVLQSYEDAGIQGLCAEGRWEVAVGALRTFDLTPILRDFQQLSTNMSGMSDSPGTDEKNRSSDDRSRQFARLTTQSIALEFEAPLFCACET